MILVLISISALFLGGIYVRLEELLFADKLDQMEMQIKNQVSSLTLAYQSETKFLQKWVHTINDEGTRKINWNSIYPYFAVAQLNSQLQVIEWSFRDKSPVSTMSKENLTQLVNSFNLKGQGKEAGKEVKNIIYTDPDKKKIFLTLLAQGEKTWLFASLGESYQSVMDTQKTSPFMLTLINSDLISLANIKSEYVGQRIFENKILSEIKNGAKATASGTFAINSGEEFFAFYEKVNDADMYVYSQVSLSDLIASKNSIKNQYLIFSLGFLIILASMVMLLSKPGRENVMTSAPLAAKPTAPTKATTVATASAPPNNATATGVPANENKESAEKVNLENYMKLAGVIGNEIQIPILKMLNLTTNMLTQSRNHAEIENLKNIQNEVRSTKGVVDKLLVFAGEKNNDKVETKIETPIMRALKNLEVQLSLKAVKIEKDFKDLPKISIDMIKMTSVFENLIKNSIQALERKAGKVISIKTFQKNNHICIEIADNGEGIEKENQSKIFEPFYSTLDHRKNIGLGLSMALGVVKNHEGQILVESERGKGTKMTIELPLATKNAVAVPPAVAVAPAVTAAPTSKLEVPPVQEPSSTMEGIQMKSLQEAAASLVEEPKRLDLAAASLNIPTDDMDLMSQMSASQNEEAEEVVVLDEDTEEMVNKSKKVLDEEESQPEDNEELKLDGFDPEATVVAKLEPIKPMNLNVNVDELFDMQDETPAAIEPKNQQPVAVLDPSGAVNMIVPPKSAPRKTIRASEEFKVVIRKPKGSS